MERLEKLNLHPPGWMPSSVLPQVCFPFINTFHCPSVNWRLHKKYGVHCGKYRHRFVKIIHSTIRSFLSYHHFCFSVVSLSHALGASSIRKSSLGVLTLNRSFLIHPRSSLRSFSCSALFLGVSGLFSFSLT